MKVINNSMPTKEQAMLLNQPGPSSPVFMINLIKFKEKAEYKDGRESNLTGGEAYQLYGREVVKMLPEFNAEVVIGTQLTELMIGEVDELWDEMSIVKYASREDLARMTSSERWRELNEHRLAGIEGQLNIESVQHK